MSHYDVAKAPIILVPPPIKEIEKEAAKTSDSVNAGKDLEGSGNNSAKLNMSNNNNANIVSANTSLFEHKDPKSTQSYSSLGHPTTTGAKDPAKMTTAEIMFDTTNNSLVNSMTWQSKSQASDITLLLNGSNTTAIVNRQQNLLSTAPLFTFAGKTTQEKKDLKNMTEDEIKNYPPDFLNYA